MRRVFGHHGDAQQGSVSGARYVRRRHMRIVLGESHLRRILASYFDYYHASIVTYLLNIKRKTPMIARLLARTKL